jgi:hypothetical protein
MTDRTPTAAEQGTLAIFDGYLTCISLDRHSIACLTSIVVHIIGGKFTSAEYAILRPFREQYRALPPSPAHPDKDGKYEGRAQVVREATIALQKLSGSDRFPYGDDPTFSRIRSYLSR